MRCVIVFRGSETWKSEALTLGASPKAFNSCAVAWMQRVSKGEVFSLGHRAWILVCHAVALTQLWRNGWLFRYNPCAGSSARSMCVIQRCDLELCSHTWMQWGSRGRIISLGTVRMRVCMSVRFSSFCILRVPLDLQT